MYYKIWAYESNYVLLTKSSISRNNSCIGTPHVCKINSRLHNNHLCTSISSPRGWIFSTCSIHENLLFLTKEYRYRELSRQTNFEATFQHSGFVLCMLGSTNQDPQISTCQPIHACFFYLYILYLSIVLLYSWFLSPWDTHVCFSTSLLPSWIARLYLVTSGVLFQTSYTHCTLANGE